MFGTKVLEERKVHISHTNTLSTNLNSCKATEQRDMNGERSSIMLRTHFLMHYLCGTPGENAIIPIGRVYYRHQLSSAGQV